MVELKKKNRKRSKTERVGALLSSFAKTMKVKARVQAQSRSLVNLQCWNLNSPPFLRTFHYVPTLCCFHSRC